MTVRRHGAHLQTCARCIPSCSGRTPTCTGRTPCMGRSTCARCSTVLSGLAGSLGRCSGSVELGRRDRIDRAAVEPAIARQQAYGLQMIHGSTHSARRHAAARGDGADGWPAHAIVVGLVSQRDQDSLLRDAQALKRPALRHDDGRHVRAPGPGSRPERPATRCKRYRRRWRKAPSGLSTRGPVSPTQAGDGRSCVGLAQ